MKNYIPLVLAVLLGLAAVLAVARLLADRKRVTEESATVVVTLRKVSAGEHFQESNLGEKQVPRSARPADAIPSLKKGLLIGQQANKAIVEGDYVLFSDIATERSMVADGEWAVALHTGVGGMAGLLRPGDEVAIIGTSTFQEPVQSADLSAPREEASSEITLVLFPRVRVLQTSDGSRRDVANQIVVALPPQQAQVLIAAQRKFDITLALRKPGDRSSLDRMDAGSVDKQTFLKMLEGVPSVVLPRIPSSAEKAITVR